MTKNKTPNRNTFSAWKKHEHFVLSSLERLEAAQTHTHELFEKHIEAQAKDFTEVRVTMQELKVKLAMWGAIILVAAGLISPLVADLIKLWLR